MMTQFSDTYMQLYGDMIYDREFKFGWIREPLSVIKMINYQAKENCWLEEQKTLGNNHIHLRVKIVHIFWEMWIYRYNN